MGRRHGPGLRRRAGEDRHRREGRSRLLHDAHPRPVHQRGGRPPRRGGCHSRRSTRRSSTSASRSGPVALLDEVGIDVAAHVSKDLGKAFASRGAAPSDTFTKLFDAGYRGRKNAKGFYLYPKDRPSGRTKEVNPEVYSFFGGASRKAMPAADLVDRLALLMVNEAVWCLAEGIIASPRDGDAGAILGLGFPPFRGGPFRLRRRRRRGRRSWSGWRSSPSGTASASRRRRCSSRWRGRGRGSTV